MRAHFLKKQVLWQNTINLQLDQIAHQGHMDDILFHQVCHLKQKENFFDQQREDFEHGGTNNLWRTNVAENARISSFHKSCDVLSQT